MLEKRLKPKTRNNAQVPVIFDLKQNYFREQLDKLLEISPSIVVFDTYPNQIQEYFEISRPGLKSQPKQYRVLVTEYIEENQPLWQDGRWVYFPWNKQLVHILESKKFIQVRTARNHNIITPAEQSEFSKAKIGVAGMSVGNSAAMSIVITGGAQSELRIADFDQLSLSNMNRLRSSVVHLDLNKVYLAAQQIYELNPYQGLSIFDQGLNDDNLEKFVIGLNLIVDEVDDLIIKIKLRQLAQKYQIPVVSGTDNGDHVIVDIERFDLEPNLPIFHGNLANINIEDIPSFDFAQRLELINKIVGETYIAPRMLESLQEIGKTLYSWPQLGSTVSVCGGVVAYLSRQIIIGKDITSGKYNLDLDSSLQLVD